MLARSRHHKSSLLILITASIAVRSALLFRPIVIGGEKRDRAPAGRHQPRRLVAAGHGVNQPFQGFARGRAGVQPQEILRANRRTDALDLEVFGPDGHGVRPQAGLGRVVIVDHVLLKTREREDHGREDLFVGRRILLFTAWK